MPRFHEPYTLYTRSMSDGRKVYYYQARDPETGARLPGLSTGKLTAREAYAWCDAALAAGTLIPGPKEVKPAIEVRRSRRPPTLAEWAAERHWWQWTDEGPACLYCRGELKRSDEGAPAVQREYADKNGRILENNILPYLGSKRMDQVTPGDCEDMLTSWSADVGNKTINNRASVARVMFREAARLRIIPSSPWEAVKGYSVAEYKRGRISIDEYKALMDPRDIGSRWSRAIYYDLNLLASVTGFRMSECLAIHPEAVHADHITVSVKWRIGYGEGPQKTKRGTDEIPIPKMVAERLLKLASITPPGGFIFSVGDGSAPCTEGRVADALIAALVAIGIDDEATARKEKRPPMPGSRNERHISFHSWRVFANTYFKNAGVPDEKIRNVTRHESEEMTAHYTAFRLEDFREVADAQATLVAGLIE